MGWWIWLGWRVLGIKISIGLRRRGFRLSRELNLWFVLSSSYSSPFVLFAHDLPYVQVRAANSLLSITHSMKLLLLLSDEAQIAHRRDAELKDVVKEKQSAQEEVAKLLDELLAVKR